MQRPAWRRTTTERPCRAVHTECRARSVRSVVASRILSRSLVAIWFTGGLGERSESETGMHMGERTRVHTLRHTQTYIERTHTRARDAKHVCKHPLSRSQSATPAGPSHSKREEGRQAGRKCSCASEIHHREKNNHACRSRERERGRGAQSRLPSQINGTSTEGLHSRYNGNGV